MKGPGSSTTARLHGEVVHGPHNPTTLQPDVLTLERIWLIKMIMHFPRESEAVSLRRACSGETRM